MFMKIVERNTITNCIVILALLTLASCGNTKKVIMFPELKDGIISSNTPFPESIIQKSDIISITVSSLNPEASAIFNSPNAGGGGAATPVAGGAAPSGYLVNTEGFIQFPILGNIKAEGLTKNQLKDKIVDSLIKKKLL